MHKIEVNLVAIPDGALQIARKMKIVPEIHSDDFIYHFIEKRWGGDRNRAVTNYYELGHYSAKLARDHIEVVQRLYKQQFGLDWNPANLTDFASGYGGVARHLSNHFPNSDVRICDIHKQAVEFCERFLEVDGFLSSPIPEELDIPTTDLIVALSFFSHMPRQSYARWMSTLASRLSEKGALIFTANGHLGEKVILKSNAIDVEEDGFGFKPMSEQKDLNVEQYGLTISHPRFVLRILKELPLRVVRFEEGQWWNTQDTYVCVKM